MSEHELQPLTTQAALLSVVEELERSAEEMTASLTKVRSAIREIASHVRDLDAQVASASETAAPLLIVVEATAEPEQVEADHSSFSWSPPAVAPVPEATSPDNAELPIEAEAEAEIDAAAAEAARDEVRRAVEATRAEMSWSNLRVDTGFNVGPRETSSEPSQPIARQPEAVSPAAPSAPAQDDEEARREEVRFAVERARAEMAAANDAEPPVDPEEARREEVRLAVERARAEMYAAEEKPTTDEDDARREEVRRTVESTRGSLSWSDMKVDASGWGQFKPEPGGFSIGPDQAPPRPLEPVDAPGPPLTEIEVPAASSTETPLSEEEARREEVRRAVEAARAEMMNGAEPARPSIVPIVPRPGAAPAKGSDFNGPPVIVIEDPLGRVELSQVFATLSRVDSSAQAALLNYSPHSVTIGLSMQSTVPDPNQLVLAAQAVFGRVCSVKSEGNRTAIEIGTHTVGAPK